MQEDDFAIEKLVLVKLMRFNAVISGLTFGIILGLGIFMATNILLLKGGDVVGPHLSLLGHFFIGYEVSFLGSLIGFVYGCLTGFVVGYLFAYLYNWVANLRERKRSSSNQP
jgi:hypothetical protein